MFGSAGAPLFKRLAIAIVVFHVLMLVGTTPSPSSS